MRITYLLSTMAILMIGFDESHQTLFAQANSTQDKQSQATNLEPDLSKIGHISPKGRIQDADYNQSTVVSQLIRREREVIPYLISKLNDETKLKEGTVDFWHKATVGDVALIILTDLFTDTSWDKTTIPGVGWDDILKRKSVDQTAEEVLREFIAKHGRQAIKSKWQRIWNENKERLYWEDTEKCFKLKPV